MTPRLVLLAAVAAALLTLASGAPAAAHGAPTSPTSRTASCGAEGDASDTAACRAALRQSPKLAEQWDNVRVADVRGRDREVIPDGKLCSAGIRAYGGLDLARADWPATTLSPGAEQRFTYRGTIGHHGTFRLYVTRPGYSPDRPLTWSDLEPEPFLTVADPPLHGGSYRFEGALPADRSGRQLIYTIWRNSDTPDTYYSCSDVDFGAGRPEAAAAPPASPRTAATSPRTAPASAAGTGAAAAGSETGMPTALVGGGVLLAVLLGLGVLLAVRRRNGHGGDPTG